jgi:hypothetical protein
MVETERVGETEEPYNQPPRLESVITVRSTPPAIDIEEAWPLGVAGSVSEHR